MGTLVNDTVELGGFTSSNTTIGACTTMDVLSYSWMSGILGMGWSSLSSAGATPFVEQLYQDSKLDSPAFALAFATWSGNSSLYERKEQGGVLSLGGVVPSLYSGNIGWNPLVGDPKGARGRWGREVCAAIGRQRYAIQVTPPSAQAHLTTSARSSFLSLS